ncbi:MAG: hypothetical protein M3083_10575, partial [Actinomycetota bacterium]|nr:hypothetical protein [Actinomycetota bacterium]
MGMYAVQADDSGELTELSTAARDGRTVAKLRRVALSQGMQALNGDGVQLAAENLQVNGAGAPPAASNGQTATNGAQGAPEATAVATNGVASSHLGRAISMERRRQLSQGKQAMNGGADPTGAAADAGAPPAAPERQAAPSGAPVAPEATA